MRIDRKRIADGAMLPPLYDEVVPETYLTVTYVIPGCKDGKTPAGPWQPPETFVYPTAGTSIVEGGEAYLYFQDVEWRLLKPPGTTVEGCVVTGRYQQYWRREKRKVSDGTSSVSYEATDPPVTQEFSFRIPGCYDGVRQAGELGAAPLPKAEMRRAELRCALVLAMAERCAEDLARTRMLLDEARTRIDAAILGAPATAHPLFADDAAPPKPKAPPLG